MIYLNPDTALCFIDLHCDGETTEAIFQSHVSRMEGLPRLLSQ